jgi:beta-glucanase (GH16 family)
LDGYQQERLYVMLWPTGLSSARFSVEYLWVFLTIFSFLPVDTNAALHFYSDENARTKNGVLNISTIQKVNDYRAFDEKKKIFYADKKYVQTAMMQSWNKFCFTGGIVEFSARLPGEHDVGGLWPARKFMKQGTKGEIDTTF